MLDFKKSALCMALPVMFLGGVALESPKAQTWLAHGPIQSGHAEVDCAGCHQASPGTIRQQIQANVHYILGLRPDSADFGKAAVTSETCLDCHERPNERHPIYRFREPRFIEALETVAADTCLGCHTEHRDERVASDMGVCRACHDDLKMKNDPLDRSHAELVAAKEWGSCMGCHDFHGNHVFEPPKLMAARIPEGQIRAYLSNGPNPYGTRKLYEAKPE